MNKTEKDKAIKITEELKKGVRKLIDRHATGIGMLNVATDDPHVAIVGCVQIALATASTEYLIKCGCSPDEAVQRMANTTQEAMGRWLTSVMQPVKPATSNGNT